MICTVPLMRHGGSHLIRPIVAALGGDPIIEPGRVTAPIDESHGPVIVFRRDPRDRMAATQRWWTGKPRKLQSMRQGGDDADGQIAWLLIEGGFLPEMLRWARIWCNRPDALTVRFEDMRERGTDEIARIAEHLGKPRDYQRDAEIWESIWLKGRTYTGKHSDWREYFGPKSNAVWEREGGPELVRLMGYV